MPVWCKHTLSVYSAAQPVQTGSCCHARKTKTVIYNWELGKASHSRIMGHRQQWISSSIVKSTSEAVTSPSYPLTGHCLGKCKVKTSWNCCLTFSRTEFSRYYMVNVEISDKISIKDISMKRISNCYTAGIQVKFFEKFLQGYST